MTKQAEPITPDPLELLQQLPVPSGLVPLAEWLLDRFEGKRT